jgi:thiol-disulfide isomerase/thioredoxin
MRGLVSRTIFVIATACCAASAHAAAATTAGDKDDFLKPGDEVAPFEAEGVDGVVRRVEFGQDQVTILLFFSSGCPACHKMIPEWNRAFARRASNLAVIGVIVDSPPPRFFEMVPISFPVLRSPGRDFLDRFKVARIPLTMRVASSGKIAEVGVGPLDGIRLGQLFRP